ncbi:MAG: hypothetical protein P4L49_00070 [Desulfosporosinus sp.]|nr:hypothetical protein [Desulfosporosinus sp.]
MLISFPAKRLFITVVFPYSKCIIDVTRQRMIARKSDRDTWKLAHWDEYIAGRNFDIPIALDDPNIKDDLLIFKNSSDEEFTDSLKQIVLILEESSLDNSACLENMFHSSRC